MQAGNGTRAIEAWTEGGTARRWQEVILAAQQDLADALLGAIADGRLNRQSYQHWLATESAVCRINALALDAVADWHVSQPALRATAQAWAQATRDDALLAAADVRGLDGIAAATPPQFGLWQVFLHSASQCPRAGEALGAVVLHARLLQGPVRAAVAAINAQAFVPLRGGRYLQQRGQAEADGVQRERAALLDAYSGAAIAAGAQRAAGWYRDALATMLAPAASTRAATVEVGA